VHNCRFENATTTAQGSISAFYNPFVGGGGGAIHVAVGALEVAGSRFTRCSAPRGGGGAILLTDTDTSGSARRPGLGAAGSSGGSWIQLNISDSAFEGCAASVAGGAVAMVNYGKSVGAGVVLVRSTFTQGTVGAGDGTSYFAFGGGLYMFYCKDVIGSNQAHSGCTFANNSLTSNGDYGAAYGGGLYLQYSWISVTSSPVSLDGEESLVQWDAVVGTLRCWVVGFPGERKGMCVTALGWLGWYDAVR
jgi:hypothetical protein